MQIYITPEQKKLIDRINQCGIKLERANVAIYLYFNRIIKPKDELAHILTHHDQSLDTVCEAIDWMLEKDLAREVRSESLNANCIKINDALPDIMEKLTNCGGLAKDLRKKYDSSTPPVIVDPKGTVGRREGNYEEMISHIKMAKKSIKYAVLTTPPNPVTVKPLINAANKGVTVQVLVACDKLTRSIKGKRSTVAEWKREMHGIKNATVKVFSDPQGVELCSSIIIDNKTLRLDIYDYRRNRSLDGFLIEVSNRDGEHLNIIDWTIKKFDHIWSKSYKSIPNQVISCIFSPFWISFATCVICGCAYYVLEDLWQEVDLIVLGCTLPNLAHKLWKGFVHLCNAIKEALLNPRSE